MVLTAQVQGPAGMLPVTVIMNHLRSLSGVEDPIDGRVRAKRLAQAEFLANLIQARQAAHPTERIISVGDYNAFQVNDGYVDVIGSIKGTPAPADQVVLAGADLVNPEPPVLALTGSTPMAVEVGGTFIDPGATAEDVCAGNLSSSIAISGGVDTTHVGTYQITYTVSDGYNTASVTRTVNVVDTTPPVISAVSPSSSILWPPNHQFMTVGLDYSATDNSGAAACSVGVLSTEPVNGTGDGDTSPDWQVIDGTTVQLRAERTGGGSGRVYTITVTCRDASGNAATKSTTVSVPKSKGK